MTAYWQRRIAEHDGLLTDVKRGQSVVLSMGRTMGKIALDPV